ncbi:hypothetical protein F5Y06DRAFT_300143 [Hypoxylon sp. FL0890]|nr:hypothetical protein F5Y06DRAFT_300143 [Hypoxylon sp. FL0890]
MIEDKYSNLKTKVARLENSEFLQSKISSSTWSNQAITQACAWISACPKTDDDCRVRRNPGRLPLRLINTTPETALCAYVTRKVFRWDTEYLTLSYRWSRSPTLILNDKSMALFLDKIPAENTAEP